MMNCFKLRSVAAKLSGFVAAVALMASCSADVDPELGYDILPENQKMEMRHLTFKGDKLITFTKGSVADADGVVGGQRDTVQGKFFETRLYQTDSLLSSNVNCGYLGVERSDTFGVRTAALATSMIFMNTTDKETGFGYKPIFDTMKITLSIVSYGADTLTPVRYKVYELKRPLFRNIVKCNDGDTAAYANCDLSQVYDSSKPIFEFTFPDGVKTGPTYISTVAMTPVDMRTKERDGVDGATWDFVRRLLLIPADYATSKEWDGYARDKDSLYSDEKAWAQNFYGLYIEPDMSSVAEGKRGSIYGFDLATSGVMFFGRNRNEKDPTLIQDSIGVNYAFYDSTVAEYDVYGNISTDTMNMSVNKITHDYKRGLYDSQESLLGGVKMAAYDASGNKVLRTERDLIPNEKLDVCVVEGMAGATTELCFTDEFLEALLNLRVDADGTEFRTIGVNQCLLNVYLEDADYDWEKTQNDIISGDLNVWLTRLNSSMSRLGSYTSVGKLTPIPDYNYSYEVQQGTSLNYDGNLNRSRACYVMDVTAYMQRLFNYVASLNDLKEYDETKFSRAIYLGPDATSPYTLNRTLLQGAEGQAPIHIELTYTVIK